MKKKKAKPQPKFCFDVTADLGERPIEAAYGYIGTEMVLCAVRKATASNLHIAAMWEVKNGLHLRRTVGTLTCRGESGHKLIDSLWLLFGENNTNLKEIRLDKKLFAGAAAFWDSVAEHGVTRAIVRTRLSEKMSKKIKAEPESLS